MTSDHSASNNSVNGPTNNSCLKMVDTGIYVDWDKKNIIVKGIAKSLRERCGTQLNFGDRQPNDRCQLILCALNPPHHSSSRPPCTQTPLSHNFAGSKVLLEKYLSMVQATIPSFKFEKQPEMISIEDSDDEASLIVIEDEITTCTSNRCLKKSVDIGKSSTVNVVTVDLSEENHKDDSFASDVQCLEVESSCNSSEILDSILVEKSDQVDNDSSYASDIDCVWVKSVPIITGKPDGHLLKTNDPVDIKKDESMTSDCMIVENVHENNNNPIFQQHSALKAGVPNTSVDEQHSSLESGVSTNKKTKKKKTGKLLNSATVVSNEIKNSTTNAKKKRLLAYKRLSHLTQTSPEPDGQLLKINDAVDREKDESLASDVDCMIITVVENDQENMGKSNNALRKNDSDQNEQVSLYASDSECIIVENTHKNSGPLKNNGPNTVVNLDISDIDCVFVSSVREQYKNNPRINRALGLANLNVHTVGDKRTVVLNPESSPKPTKKRKISPDKKREKRYNKKRRLNSEKNSHAYTTDEGQCFTKIVDQQHSGLESGVSKKRTKKVKRKGKSSHPATVVSNQMTNSTINQATEGPPTQELNPFSSLKNSSVATNNDVKKNRLLAYKRLPHLNQTSPEKPPSTSTSSNIYNPVAPVIKRTGLRPIVIDGSNVAISHGLGKFSVKGIQLCINFFEKRGHRDIKAFVPQFRKNQETHGQLTLMEKQGTLVVTPSRKVDGIMVASYDDRFIVQYAHETGGVIISLDNYRDLMTESPEWKETIQRRTLMFSWAGDMLMFPKDPLGRHGPTLDEYLRFD